jgi:tetratricopeptide (TPR) repeat protein
MKDDRSAPRGDAVRGGRHVMTERRATPKKRRGLFIAAIVIFVIGAASLLYVGYRRSLERSGFALRVAEMGPGGSPPETIEGLKKAIAIYEDRIEAVVNDAGKAGIYWKLLATRYMDKGMYGEALEALEKAISYFPEDASLFYRVGISASVVAKSTLDFKATGRNAERDRLLATAVDAHLRAIALEKTYSRPLYALGVLYVFELGREQDAIPLLTRYLELESKDVDAMFVLARAHYVLGEYQKAVDLYDRILSTTKDDAKQREAETNKKTALDALYG